ncbi:MAG TPA: hypothetical protein VIX18_12075, partial [Nitrospirota bacterium]
MLRTFAAHWVIGSRVISTLRFFARPSLRDNLGRHSGVVAAVMLLLDYLLNVCVGISAGIGAVVSAIPALH